MAKVLVKGNEALAEAAIRSGCKLFFGYPITPQTEVSAYMAKKLPKIGGCFLQAESEVSAINMVYGAGGSGKRVMTSSSSPGISLKQEGISYIAGADVPCVIVNIVRGGPGLGGIQPAQSDYFQAVKGGGHGDYHLIVLAPSSIQEMVDLTSLAFNLADEYRMPVMIMGDGMLGQMMEPVEFPEEDEGAVYAEKGWAANGTKMERKHNIINSLYIEAKELEDTILERQKKYDVIVKNEPRCEEMNTEDADIILVAYGTTARIAKTAMMKAREKGIKVGLIRPITLWPFPTENFKKHADGKKKFLCVEMSMGQMVEDVKLAIDCKNSVDFFGRTGGIVPTPNEILNKIDEISGGAF
ncbi:MAG: 3-methyl-2-oxobutanoate dehydrogenase subunit VorB [Ruminococcaceae bacterium]|nr:3-methyl-2-oxobutanoate dehydrogenase subunit VorB [Oscillospiraceae bacterium]